MIQPPLPALRAFVEVGRRGGVKDAAAALGVTPGAVSQQVRALELRLGVALLERLHRGVRLSAEGERLFAALDPGFRQIDDALRPYGGRPGRTNLLTVTTTPSFAATWLAQRLGAFAAVHPDIEVRLLAGVGLADLHGGEADLAIRHGGGDYPGLVSLRLFDPHLIVVASPRRLVEGPPVRRPADCLAHPLLQDRNRRDWSQWAEASGDGASPRWRDGSILADDALLIRAAIAGQGLAVVRDIYAADELAAGRLIRVLTNTAPTADAYFLVARPDRMAQRRAKAFRDWLLGAVEAFAAGI